MAYDRHSPAERCIHGVITCSQCRWFQGHPIEWWNDDHPTDDLRVAGVQNAEQ